MSATTEPPPADAAGPSATVVDLAGVGDRVPAIDAGPSRIERRRAGSVPGAVRMPALVGAWSGGRGPGE